MNTILFVGEHLKTFDVRWHAHENWEFVYCTGGEGEFRFQNGTVISYCAGDVVVVPPGEVHTNVSSEGFTNIHITMAEPSFPYRNAFRVTDDEEGNGRMAFMQAKYFYMGDIKNSDMVLNALGDLIVSYIVVCRSNAEFSEPVEKIRSSILRNYSRPEFSLEEVMRSLPFHYDYLRKLFKKEVGMSPLEYMTALRMKSAETMLGSMWTNEYSIMEVAQMCGYDDALYFSRVFKKYYGCAPTNYVKRRKKTFAADPGRTSLEDDQSKDT